jgi:Flp pilus assembly protein TadD
MNCKYILILTLVLTLSGCWDDDKKKQAEKESQQKASHDYLMENQLKPSPAYDVMKYTKPVQ